MALPQESIIFGEFSVAAGRDGLRRALKLKPRPTALICSTDLVAAGALGEAAQAGIKVPDELSITGFDDIVYASLLTPQLTTVHVPAAEMGLKAGDSILKMMAGLPDEPAVVATRLVIRGSTGPAPRRPRK
jgi:LacI family transcriptional regulator